MNCGTGSNITIGSRENRIYRITPRENNDVNSFWLPDSHRLNFKYVGSEDRLTAPALRGAPADWNQALAVAGEVLKKHSGAAIAMACSTRRSAAASSWAISSPRLRRASNPLSRSWRAFPYATAITNAQRSTLERKWLLHKIRFGTA